MRPVAILCAFASIAPCCSQSIAQSNWQPPPASATLVDGIPIASGVRVGRRFRRRFMDFDNDCTCDGKPQRKQDCDLDPNSNHVLLKLTGGVIFFDAKLDIDNDGSPYSKLRRNTDQPQTTLRYEELPGRPSLNADAVPYIVLPLGGFIGELGLETGDLAAVIYKDKLVYAIVGDEGPKCKIGEGSIQLHELLGNQVCRKRNPAGDCTDVDESRGIDKNVLFFVFPDSARLILPGLTPENINARIRQLGPRLFNALKTGPN
ncbi:MAG TPA: glycoside hydrolase family 75 protein [Terracidiphilus sp.]|nr:glycoside hydrolase family 75 protein [Terracidiphilus sp.]